MKRSVEIKTKDYGPSDIHDRPLYAGRRHNVFLGGKLVGYVNEIVSVTPLGKRAGYERDLSEIGGAAEIRQIACGPRDRLHAADDALIQKSAAAERVRRIRASLQHLLDLKRQGYSPRYCELVVDRHDRILARPQRRASPASKPRPMVQTMLLRRRQRL